MERYNHLDGVESKESHDELLEGIHHPSQTENTENVVEYGQIKQPIQWGVHVACHHTKVEKFKFTTCQSMCIV
ncbi:MAG: hypothetical protein Phog2KO_50940 [Phototrophicaceae bacterium]